MSPTAQRPVTAVIVGCGHRGLKYASYARERPDRLRIVGVADTLRERRDAAAVAFGVPADRCFGSAEELASVPRIADAVINGTMDRQHVPTSLPLLAAGYDILLEKPFATSEEEMWDLVEARRRFGRKMMICHVLRYAPFYTAVKERLAAGQIGEILNIQTVEHVSYHHMAVGFVRGKWSSRQESGSSMLMAKCCHDLDLLTWMKAGVRPRSVSSFGGNLQFRPDQAPEGAGTRCLVDCPIEPDCLYSARKHYLDHPDRWAFYVWSGLEDVVSPTPEQRADLLRGDDRYGRCVWHSDNDVVDHQSVAIEFEDGTTATHNMVGGTSRPMRSIHVIGTRGEIQGVFEESRFVVRHIDPRPGHEYTEESVEVEAGGDTQGRYGGHGGGDMQGGYGGHGGGDLRLVDDFVSFVRDEPRSISCSSVEDSINGHLIGFCADRAMEERRVVDIPKVAAG